MIAGARRKNYEAAANNNERHDGPVPRKILTLISDVELKDPEYLIDDVIEGKSLIGLIGPSGSGKTLTIKIARVVQPPSKARWILKFWLSRSVKPISS